MNQTSDNSLGRATDRGFAPPRSTFWLHGIGLVVSALCPGYWIWSTITRMPVALRPWPLVMLGFFLLVWLVLYFCYPRRRPADGLTEAQRRDVAIFWIGTLMTATVTALSFPYADDATRLLGALFSTGSMAVLALATARQALVGRSADIVPFVMPMTMAAFFVTMGAQHWHVTAFFMLAICGTIAVQRNHARQLILQLNEARREAERERDTRLRFIASASHDLAQPLHSARLFLDQALQANDPAKRERQAGKARWAFGNAEMMLRGMIDHLRLETGTTPARMGLCEAGDILTRVAELNEPMARMAGINIRTLPSSRMINVDPALAERALSNFVNNAIRHARPKNILIGAKSHKGRTRLWVIDDGVGIPSEDRASLFEDFVQGKDHGQQVRGGFGLGLASARRMADLMVGRVAHDARWQRGSAFYLELA